LSEKKKVPKTQSQNLFQKLAAVALTKNTIRPSKLTPIFEQKIFKLAPRPDVYVCQGDQISL
jgi:hypothetical protein